jgi:hypothetical protein
MHNTVWVKLLGHIPEGDQAKFMLVTTGGTEIAIQCFLRIDPEVLVLRGRLAGSTDAGRVFFIPFAHIDYFGSQQPVKEAEFHELFDKLEPMGHTPPPAPAAPSVVPELAAPPAARGQQAIKSTVLERFRSRSVTSPGTQLRPPLDE